MDSCLQMDSQQCCRWSIRFLSCLRPRDEVLLGCFKKMMGPGGLNRRVETVSKGRSRLLWQPHPTPPPRQLLLKQTGPEEQVGLRVEDTIFRTDVLPPSSVWLIYNEQNDSTASVLVYAAAGKLIYRLYDLMHPEIWWLMFPWKRKHVILLHSVSYISFVSRRLALCTDVLWQH